MPKKIYRPITIALLLALISVMVVSADPLSTSTFTYQGQLSYQGALANGSFDFEFALYDAASGGAPIGGTNARPAVDVSEGLFTVELDFGAAVFDGNARWLEISVRPAGAGAYTLLAPRQEVTPTPYAMFSGDTAALQSYPVDTNAPANGQVLSWDGTTWGPSPYLRLLDAALSPNIIAGSSTNRVTGGGRSRTARLHIPVYGSRQRTREQPGDEPARRHDEWRKGRRG